jgi:hypothetical protein
MIQCYHSWAYIQKNVSQDKIEKLHTNVYCSTDHNNQAIETIQMSNNWWLHQENYIYIYIYHSFIQP